MTRITVSVFVLFLATARLCQAQQIPEPMPLSNYSLSRALQHLQLVQQLPEPTPMPKGKVPLPLPSGKDKDKEKDKEPLPLPKDKDKETTPKEEAVPAPREVKADAQPRNPPPILFPAPPYPPAAPAVVDPRTGAWEQMHSPLEAGADMEGPGMPVGHHPLLQVRKALRHWIYHYNHSGAGAGGIVIDVSPSEGSSEWHAVEDKPGH
jgi:hypothetical protein